MAIGFRIFKWEFGQGVRVTNTVSEEELTAAYEEHAERARRVNEEWKHVSSEANNAL